MTFLQMPLINKDYLLASGPFECPAWGNLVCTGGPCKCESCLSLLSHVIHLLLLDDLLLFKIPNMKGLMFFDAVLMMLLWPAFYFLADAGLFFYFLDWCHSLDQWVNGTSSEPISSALLASFTLVKDSGSLSQIMRMVSGCRWCRPGKPDLCH